MVRFLQNSVDKHLCWSPWISKKFWMCCQYLQIKRLKSFHWQIRRMSHTGPRIPCSTKRLVLSSVHTLQMSYAFQITMVNTLFTSLQTISLLFTCLTPKGLWIYVLWYRKYSVKNINQKNNKKIQWCWFFWFS